MYTSSLKRTYFACMKDLMSEIDYVFNENGILTCEGENGIFDEGLIIFTFQSSGIVKIKLREKPLPEGFEIIEHNNGRCSIQCACNKFKFWPIEGIDKDIIVMAKLVELKTYLEKLND